MQKHEFFRENILKRNLLSEVLDNHISQKIWRWQQMSFMASILQISKSRAVISTLGKIRYENVKPLSEIRTFTLKQYILMNSFEISKNLTKTNIFAELLQQILFSVHRNISWTSFMISLKCTSVLYVRILMTQRQSKFSCFTLIPQA